MDEEKNIYDLTALLAEDNEDIVKELIKKHGGEDITDVRSFSKINLSYMIKGNSFAFMSAVKFFISPSSLISLKEEMNNNNQILRYLVLKVEVKNKKTSDKRTRKIEKQDKKPIKRDDFVSNEDLEEKIKEFE